MTPVDSAKAAMGRCSHEKHRESIGGKWKAGECGATVGSGVHDGVEAESSLAAHANGSEVHPP